MKHLKYNDASTIILQYFLEFANTHGQWPNIREITEYMEFSSTSITIRWLNLMVLHKVLTQYKPKGSYMPVNYTLVVKEVNND